MTPTHTGDSLRRVEDVPLLRGQSTFVANLDFDDVAFVFYVTATVAHAEFTVDVEAARRAKGVLAVVTGVDVAAAGLPELAPGRRPDDPAYAGRRVLARGRVRHVGEPIVAIVAESETDAVDAAELVVVDYDRVPPVIGIEAALSAAPMYVGADSNVLMTDARADSEPLDLRGFEVIVEATINNNRVAPAPLEGRVGAARWLDGRLVQYASCQGVHPVRAALAEWYGLETQQVRVLTADVGGSFGAKARLYAEELLLGHLARVVDRPVRWVPHRTADMAGLGHSRAQRQHVTVAGDRDGTIRALQAHVQVDAGAYPVAAGAQGRNTGRMLPGPYDIEHVHFTIETLATTTNSIVAYRGAGRPESAALINRAIDLFAAEIELDPVDVRRRNLLPASRLPMTNHGGVTYDTGDYVEAFELVLEHVDADGVRSEQARRRSDGATRMLGLGTAVFVDRTAGVKGNDYGAVRLMRDGMFDVLTSSSPYGQGHYTTWIQVVSERTGAPVDAIRVRHGDTDLVPRGGITGGSRSGQKAGSAIALSTDELVELARRSAADLLEAGVDDVVLDVATGRFHVAGAPGAATVGWAELASQVADHESATDDIVMGCENDYDYTGHTVPYGAYAALVEVDTETGAVDLLRMVTVDDAGTLINPMIAAGQIHGGVVQGIGQALYEEVLFDEDGTPLTSNLLDYTMPSAAEVPNIEAHFTEHPALNNLLGAKGIGESGCMAVPAVQNAVIDAVAHLGIRHIDLPLTPMRVWQAISEA